MAWNAFRLCMGLRVLGSVMILVVLGVVAVTYYALVWTNYWPQLLQGGYHALLALPVLLLFHLLLAMLLWCYFATVFTDPGSVPPGWRPPMEEDELEAQGQLSIPPPPPLPPPAPPTKAGAAGGPPPDDASAPLVGVRPGGAAGSQALTPVASVTLQSAAGFRRCRKCGQFKPPRTHHCSVCGRCVLKMDHHCVWVVNCVGAKNYKFFLLFLVYTLLTTALAAAALLPKFLSFFQDLPDESEAGDVAVTFLAFVLCLAFAVSLLGFLFMHASLIAGNTTTIEAYETKQTGRWRYDLGRQRNFEQVFGHDRLYWFLPMYSADDLRRIPALHGLDYPTRNDLEALDF